MSEWVKRIVLTGGPCAGKSTGLAIVKKRLEELGYKVIIMSEMATEVMNSGLNAANLNPVRFQELLLKMQMNRDFLYEKYIKCLPNKVIVLYDRGIIDGFAYCDYETFATMLRDNNHQYYELMNYYDAVFHLTTAAIGAEKYYTLANNSVRLETLDEARVADARTMKAWLGHPHFRVIDNENVNFDGKMNHLLKEIMDFLGEPTPLEKERKFLIKMPDFIYKWQVGVLKDFNMVSTHILQTYLVSDDNKERRIRQRGFNGDYSYYYTEKISVNDDSTFERIEKERQITQKEYNTLMMEAIYNLPSLHKERYCFVFNNMYFELDVYPYWEDYAILEIETDKEEGVIDMPNFITLIKEVTKEKGFSNRQLAEHTTDSKYLAKMVRLLN